MENRIQLLTKFNFPQIHSKRSLAYAICVKKTNTVDTPNVITVQETDSTIFKITHLEIFMAEKKAILTAIEKFSKFAQIRIIKSRTVKDIKGPLKQLLLSFGMPETVVMENEKPFNSIVIIFVIKSV